MEVKEVEIRSKQSYNYNTYEVGLIVDMSGLNDIQQGIREFQKVARKLVEEQIQIDKDKLGGKK